MILGIIALVAPTLVRLAQQVWSTEDGAHGPIVLASGLWLLARKWRDVRAAASDGKLWLSVAGVAIGALMYLFGRMVGVLGIEMFAVAVILVVLLYAFFGTAALRAAWFPLLYLGFLIPLPDTIVALITQPLKLGISNVAARLLQFAGYPVANTGVMLQVAQYELLVAAACSGLNAIISLSAICLFYVYLLHHSTWRYSAVLLLAVVPAAIFANLARVMILILLTYHFGDAVAQGFLHNMAGMVTFVLALLFIFGVDRLLSPLRRKLADHHAG